METDILVVGQGISGTWLSFYLDQAGMDYQVIDDAAPDAPSRIASGMINPITGRRLVKTWMIDELLPFARQAYSRMAALLQRPLSHVVPIVDFPATAQMLMAYRQRANEDSTYVCVPEDEQFWTPSFRYDFGARLIQPAMRIDLQALLSGWKQYILQRGRLRTETFQQDQFRIAGGGIRYGEIRARKIIFCDGTASFHNSWFRLLPFAPSKGEALWIRTHGIPGNAIYKKGLTLVPLEDDLFWAGSTYEWEFTDPGPTPAFRMKTLFQLKEWIKVPFEIIAHKAAIRPATLERRPFAGLHPAQPQIGILNGMGTKGCSLAPYFAHQLMEHLAHQKPIQKEADVQRFSRILQKNQPRN